MISNKLGIDKYIANRWVINNPRVLPRVFKGFYRALIRKKHTLRVIELFPTFRCQSSCSFCSIAKYLKDDRAALSLDEYRKIAKDGAKLGAFVVSILGGEPFLYPELPELISIFNKEGYYIHVVSNSLELTREKLLELKKNGLDCLFLSLESLKEEVNDAIRGEGHLKKCFAGIEMAKEAGLQTGFSTVMVPERMQDAIDIAEYSYKHNLNSSGGMIAAVGGAEDMQLLSGEQQKKVRELLKKYPKLTYDWVFSYFLEQRCPAGREKIGVTCHGDVIGCSYNPVSFGNIREEPIKHILKRMQAFSQFAKKYQGCLTAEDTHYIENYLKPAHESESYPLPYNRHPAISKETEPKIWALEKSTDE